MVDINKEMLELKKDFENEFFSDVIKRTLAKLINIEKEAMYGAGNSSKNNKIEKLIDSEFSHFKDESDDN